MGISKLRKAAKKMMLTACRSLSLLHPLSSRESTAIIKQDNCSLPHKDEEAIDKPDSSSNTPHPTSTQILCAICLEPLNHCDDTYLGEAMFTGQCSHSFHVSCITSNVRHGNVTCPVCRAHWTYLPCPSFPHLSGHNQDNPVFHILDDSIATLRVHRSSFLSSARYNDDDPIDVPHSTSYPRLDFSLIPFTVSPNLVSYPCCFHLHHGAHSPLHMFRTGSDTNRSHLTMSPSMLPHPEVRPCLCTSLAKRNASLSVKLTNLRPIDLVLVVSPSGPHFQLLKQAMILVTFSLRPVDRLAIVTYSCVATRVLTLRLMTSCGKREALQVIDQLFYMGETDPSQGIFKAIKVLKDRAYKNSQCSILHISSSPVRSHYPTSVMQMGVMVHRFHVGFGTETWNGFVMHKLEEFLDKILRGVASNIKLRIETSVARSCLDSLERREVKGKIFKVGDLRGGEERQVLLDLGEHFSVRICYSYVEGDSDECIRRRGETTLRF